MDQQVFDSFYDIEAYTDIILKAKYPFAKKGSYAVKDQCRGYLRLICPNVKCSKSFIII